MLSVLVMLGLAPSPGNAVTAGLVQPRFVPSVVSAATVQSLIASSLWGCVTARLAEMEGKTNAKDIFQGLTLFISNRRVYSRMKTPSCGGVAPSPHRILGRPHPAFRNAGNKSHEFLVTPKAVLLMC